MLIGTQTYVTLARPVRGCLGVLTTRRWRKRLWALPLVSTHLLSESPTLE